MTSRLPRYEAKCVQRRCFQCGSVPLRSDIKGMELPAANILIPLERQLIALELAAENGWMDQDATRYGGRGRPRPRRRRHCVIWGPSSRTERVTAAPPHFSAHVCCGQTVPQLLSRCIYCYWFRYFILV